MHTVLDVLRKSTLFLQKRDVPNARHDVELLLARVLAMDRMGLYLAFDRPLSELEIETSRSLIQRRGRREPLQHLLADQPFRNLDLKVTADTLIPRPETEEVVGWALDELNRLAVTSPAVLDVGTGSGCIALAIAQECDAATVLGVDMSAEALAVASENRDAVGLGKRVRLAQGDLFSPVADERFHLIVSNPPYLTPDEWADAQPEVRDYEPRQALVGGDDGLLFYRRLFAEAGAYLHPVGAVVVEIGCDQGPAVQGIAQQAGFDAVTVYMDLAGHDRAVSGRLHAAEG